MTYVVENPEGSLLWHRMAFTVSSCTAFFPVSKMITMFKFKINAMLFDNIDFSVTALLVI